MFEKCNPKVFIFVLKQQHLFLEWSIAAEGQVLFCTFLTPIWNVGELTYFDAFKKILMLLMNDSIVSEVAKKKKQVEDQKDGDDE